ncbi:MAG: alpha/beta hydrolase [Verrucomicrobia bacterium]|nr:alpha/beta hydrolase [Verrucomicrobiota bacterium]MBO7391291.1 alpha/beta hydrolase [Verrucomicrobiota bacterium]MBP5759881.1 alpha/beta hydrolase [Verrucomicrobiota bacterium]
MRSLKSLIISACLMMSLCVQAEVIRLWEGDAPGAQGAEDKDIPTLTVFKPEGKATGSSVVICPGGSYWGLADHEGAGYARFLNKYGVTAFVLKYRLASGGYHHPSMISDAARAVRVVRYNAEKWGLDPNRIAIMGSSAGGHLASSLVTHFEKEVPTALDPIDRLSSRPDLGILCYPVVTLGEFTHQGTKENLLGKEPSEGMINYMSGEKMVSKDTPPCFIWHTWEDGAVPVENSLQFAAALRKAGVPFDLHIFEKGGHGMGLAEKKVKEGDTEKTVVHPWGNDLIYWLKARKFVD